MVSKNKSSHPELPYRRIEDHGVIGDLLTAVLVSTDGAIDWCCLPHFDSPSIFGALLDSQKGGYFKIAPTTPGNTKQLYFSDTNVLRTRFLSEPGVGEIVDFMPIERPVQERQEQPQLHQIYRMVKVIRGEMEFRLECYPAFNYGRDDHKTHLKKDFGAVFESAAMTVALHSPVALQTHQSGVTATFRLKAGDVATFVFKQVEEARESQLSESGQSGQHAFRDTINYWRWWLAKSRYRGRWREMVNRSALTLKLLTYAPTGAIVAAPTLGLPELIGGGRNWDYRYTWIRDGSFTLYALLRLGFTTEAEQFMHWIKSRIEEVPSNGQLQIMYGIEGQHNLTESVLSNWEGYKGSRPVRIGNAAYKQIQLDIYGELMDSVYLYNKYGSPISYELWTNVAKLLNYVCRHWRDKDDGIWEVRGGKQHFVYSKLMCWVALDRGLRLARKRSFPADWSLWEKNRDQIYNEVMSKGWNSKLGSFVQCYGSKQLDASTLVMPLMKFLSPTDPRMLSMLDAVKETLVSDSLVYRYNQEKTPIDGLQGREGTFSMCTYWYAEALARAGRIDEARYTFESMFGYSNHLGLYSEQIGQTGESLGNFPQAFTHLALISAATNLDRILDQRPAPTAP
jgi:GH15 family glucan-1,4-alpha-glucosidase